MVTNEKDAGSHPPVTASAEAGGLAHTTGLPATPVTTERRHPADRIMAGDYVRHCDGQREGIVKASSGYFATVQWTEGGEETLAWGYIERVPAAVAAP